MNQRIQEYAKRLKLSWTREHYHEIVATNNEEYLLRLLEQEIQQRDERKTNLLLQQATLPKVVGTPFDWKDIKLGQGLTREYVLHGGFIEKKENLIFYGGVGTGKTFLSSLISLHAIQQQGKKVNLGKPTIGCPRERLVEPSVQTD